MKRLNNKGFTLIELLAVIVILALIMVIAIPNVLNSINDSRVSAIHSKAKSIVSWYSDTLLSQQMMNKTDIITAADRTADGSTAWTCLGALSTTLQSNAELSENDFVLGSSTSTDKPESNGAVTKATTCSAIRTNANGKVEVVLVASQTGRFNVGGKKVTYAFSSDQTGKTVANT